jgi:hypothetical protein
MRGRALFVPLAVVATLATSRAALAQEDAALAQTLFQEGRKLVAAGDVAQACPKFEESLRLDFALGTLLNLAECEALAGRSASAWARFGELEEKARIAAQSDREQFARRRRAELAADLAYAELRLPAAVSIDRLEVDGRALGVASYATPLPIDPGAHAVTVTVGSDRYRTPFEIPKGPGRHPVNVAVDEAHRVTPAKAAPTQAEEPAEVDGRVVAGWIGVALGVIGAGAGTYLGARALMLRDEADERCTDQVCDQEGLDRFEEGRAHANGATVAFAIGAPILAAGTGLLIWATVEPRTRSASVQIVTRF